MHSGLNTCFIKIIVALSNFLVFIIIYYFGPDNARSVNTLLMPLSSSCPKNHAAAYLMDPPCLARKTMQKNSHQILIFHLESIKLNKYFS